MSVKNTGRGWGRVSDHRTYHTPLRNTWKPGGQRGLKMNWIGAKRVKNHIKYPEKFEIGLRVWRSLVSRLVRVQEAPGSNPGTPTKKVLFSCENSTFSFKGKNIIEDELQFRQGSVPLLHDTAAPSNARGGSVLIQFQSQVLNMISPTVCGFQ